MTGRPERVVVLTAAGCHLCEAACTVVADVCTRAGVGWRELDLSDADETVRRRWSEYVPVVTVDGAVHEVFRVDAQRLRRALR